MDVTVDREEDVLIHQKLIESALMPENRPVFHVHFSESMVVGCDVNEEQSRLVTDVASSSLNEDHPIIPEPSLKFKDLVLETGKNVLDLEDNRRVQNRSLERYCIYQIMDLFHHISKVRIHVSFTLMMYERRKVNTIL